MRKIIVVGVLLAAFCISGAASAAVQNSFVPADGNVCKDIPFSGKVSDAILAATGGKASFAIEVIDRVDAKPAEQRFKIKRLRVGSDGVAVALQGGEWENCVSYATARPDQDEIKNRLLAPGEKLYPVTIDATKAEHNTAAVFVVE